MEALGLQGSWPRLLVILFVLAGAGACSSPAGGEDRSDASGGGVVWFEGLHGNGMPVDGQARLEDWLERPWPGDRALVATREVCPAGKCQVAAEVVVDRCGTLFQADLDDLDVTGADAPLYQDRRLQCYAARAVMQAGAASRSLLDGFSLAGRGVRQLPVALAFPDGPRQAMEVQRIQASGGTLGAFIDGVLQGAVMDPGGDAGPWRASVTDTRAWTRRWEVLARGDFTRDGAADLLVASSLYDSNTGALYAHRLFVVERSSAESALRVAVEIPLVPGPYLCDPYVPRCARDPAAAD